MTALFLLPALWMAQAGAPTDARLPVAVTGSSDCPAPADVEARLRELLPVRPLDRPPRVASVDRDTAGVRVVLREPEGAVVAERLLPAASGCTEAAAAAALAIAAWETEGHSEFRAVAPPVVEPPPLPPPPPPRQGFDIGVGAGAALADSWQPAVRVVGGWTPGLRGLGVGASASWEPEREVALGTGRVRWSRAAATAGLTFRVGGPRLLLETRAEGAVAFLNLRGGGFDTDLDSLGVSPGAGAGARLLLPFGAWWAAWLDAGGAWWLRPESGFTLPGTDEASLPRWSVLVSLGLSVGRFR